MHKKRFLAIIICILGIIMLAGCSITKEKTVKSGDNSKPKRITKVRLAYSGSTCEAPLFAAYKKGYFKDAGVDVELYKMDFETLKEGLASGKVDGASANFKYLKPIEQGLNLKLTAGIHTGCIQAVAPAKSNIKSIKDLKGKTIGVEAIGGGPMILLSMELQKNGIDPKTEVQWKAYPGAQLEQALAKGEIDAFGIWDPFGQLAIDKGSYNLIFSSAHDMPYNDYYCCMVGLSNDLIKNDSKTAAAVTRAWLKGAEWVSANPKEAAQLEIDNKFTGGTVELNTKLLSSYNWEPSIKKVRDNIKFYIKEEKKQKILEPSTDEKDLYNRAFAQVISDYNGK